MPDHHSAPSVSPLQAARLQAGWTRENLAWEIRVAPRTLQRWERKGTRPRRQAHIDRVAELLERPARDLFPGPAG